MVSSGTCCTLHIFNPIPDRNELIVFPQTCLDPMHTSADLKSVSGRLFMFEFSECGAVLNAMLRITHPDLYRAGMECMDALASDDDFSEAMKLWHSPFNAVSIIANRECPKHRDYYSRKPWYDLLATVGGDLDTSLEYPDIGVRFRYRSGTVTFDAGMVLRHGVSATKNDRLCFAYFMRNSVHSRLNIRPAGWNVASSVSALFNLDNM